MKPPVSIGIQMHHLVKWTGGVHFAQNIVRALDYLPTGERPTITVFVGPGVDGSIREGMGAYSRIAVVEPRRLIPGAERLLARYRGGAEHRALSREITRRQIDVLLPLQSAPERPLPCKWLGWIPDFQHLHLPEMFSAEEISDRSAAFRALADAADTLILSSNAAREDFHAFYPGFPGRVRVLPFCSVLPERVFEAAAEKVRARYGLPERFLFLTNQFWQHKNHLVAFKAIKVLRDRGADTRLYCSGSLDDYRNPEYADGLKRYIADHGLNDRVIVMGLLPREDQIQIMRLATALVQPTLFEGRSTVIEEGRSLGKVMFVSDLEVNKEQAAPGAIYFDRNSPADLADKIEVTWDKLPTCPDANAEERARAENPDRYGQFARTFLAIAREAAGMK